MTQRSATRAPLVSRPIILTVLAVIYAVAASVSAVNLIQSAENSTRSIEKIFGLYSLKNEGSQALERYNHEHPFLGLFIDSPAREEMELPTTAESNEALHSELPHDLRLVREQSRQAAWWSEFLLCASVLYVVLVLTCERSLTARGTLFALTTVSLVCFIVGILAPAMVIWTVPDIPMPTGNLSFIIQHQVRGIAAIIWELLTTGHAIIGGFLLLFSICTPLTKAALTFFVTISRNKAWNLRAGEFLHAIGKWSMADVFVAAVLLALYALKAQQATKSIPCVGLYYFIGYCLLSMTTSELLVHSAEAAGQKAGGLWTKRLGAWSIGAAFAALLVFASASSVYTYEQYTVNVKQTIRAPENPTKLDNSHLVLPAHK
jgi:paraquat-inducible protein A